MTPMVGQLLLLNVVAFLFARPGTPLYATLQLVPANVLTEPWTLITYQFLHGGTTHIFFNMLALFFFGPRLETRLGNRHFIALYLISGLIGAIVHILYTLVSAGGLYVPMVGASGAVYGVLLAYASFWPRDKVLIWFVIPVEVRVLVIGFTVISLFSGLRGGGNIAHFAHLGGFLGGGSISGGRSGARRRNSSRGRSRTRLSECARASLRRAGKGSTRPRSTR